MAKTKTAATKTTRPRTGTKTTARRTSGKVAKGKAKGTSWTVPRTAKQLADGITARLRRSPDYWNQLAAEMAARTHPQAPARVAQVEPRATQH